MEDGLIDCNVGLGKARVSTKVIQIDQWESKVKLQAFLFFPLSCLKVIF